MADCLAALMPRAVERVTARWKERDGTVCRLETKKDSMPTRRTRSIQNSTVPRPLVCGQSARKSGDYACKMAVFALSGCALPVNLTLFLSVLALHFRSTRRSRFVHVRPAICRGSLACPAQGPACPSPNDMMAGLSICPLLSQPENSSDRPVGR